MLYFSHVGNLGTHFCSLTHTPLNCIYGMLYMLLPVYLDNKYMKMNILNSFSVHIIDLWGKLMHIIQLQNPQKWTFSGWSQVHIGVTDHLTYYQCVPNVPISTNLRGRIRDKGDVTGSDMALLVPAPTWRWCELQCSGYMHTYTWIHIYMNISMYMCVCKYVSHCWSLKPSAGKGT